MTSEARARALARGFSGSVTMSSSGSAGVDVAANLATVRTVRAASQSFGGSSIKPTG